MDESRIPEWARIVGAPVLLVEDGGIGYPKRVTMTTIVRVNKMSVAVEMTGDVRYHASKTGPLELIAPKRSMHGLRPRLVAPTDESALRAMAVYDLDSTVRGVRYNVEDALRASSRAGSALPETARALMAALTEAVDLLRPLVED